MSVLSHYGSRVYDVDNDIDPEDEGWDSEPLMVQAGDSFEITALPGKPRKEAGYEWCNLYDDNMNRIGVMERPAPQECGASQGEAGGTVGSPVFLFFDGFENEWSLFFQDPGFETTDLSLKDLFSDKQLMRLRAWEKNYGDAEGDHIETMCPFVLVHLHRPVVGVLENTCPGLVFMSEAGEIMQYHGKPVQYSIEELPARIVKFLCREEGGGAPLNPP
jgi:hypothetical protein